MKFKEEEIIEVRTKAVNAPYWADKRIVTHKFNTHKYKYSVIYEGNDINIINKYLVNSLGKGNTFLEVLCNLSDIPNILSNISNNCCESFILIFYNYQNNDILRCGVTDSYPGFMQCQYNNNIYIRNDKDDLVDIVTTSESLPKKIKKSKRQIAVVLPNWSIDPSDNKFYIFDANDPDFIKDKACPDFTPTWLYKWLEQFKSCLEFVESGFEIDDIIDIKMLLASENIIIYKQKDLGW